MTRSAATKVRTGGTRPGRERDMGDLPEWVTMWEDTLREAQVLYVMRRSQPVRVTEVRNAPIGHPYG